jgi:hypothetical protein
MPNATSAAEVRRNMPDDERRGTLVKKSKKLPAFLGG